jgi:hypothetical protein
MCDTCKKLTAQLAQKEAELAEKISEIRYLTAALANQTPKATLCSSGFPPFRSAHVPAVFPEFAAGTTSALSLRSPSAFSGPAEAQREPSLSPSPGSSESLRDPVTPPSSDALNVDKKVVSSKSQAPISRNFPSGVLQNSSAVVFSDNVQESDHAADIGPSSDDDEVFFFDPSLKVGLFDMFGETFSLSYIEKVLNKVRWNQEDAVSQLLAESESITSRDRQLVSEPQHAPSCNIAQSVLHGSDSRHLSPNASNSIVNVKLEASQPKHVELKPKVSRSPSRVFDVKRPKVDSGPQIRKLKADICHEMESGKECLHLVMQFQQLSPGTWFSEPLIEFSGFSGPRIFHLACCSDAFSSTLSFLIEHVISQDRGADHCRELMTLPVCSAFIDWNKTFIAPCGTDKKRNGSRNARMQSGPDKIYSLGLKCCALHIAAHHGALSCAAILLKTAQRVDLDDSKSMLITSLLMQGGSVKDVKYRDWEPRPLDLASAAGHVNIMRLFIHHVRQFGPRSAMTPKVFVNHRGKGSSCALHWAAECFKFESIEFLLQQGADPEVSDDTGGTAVDYVINNASIQKPLCPIQVLSPSHSLI